MAEIIVWERLYAVLEKYDSSFKVNIGSRTCWAGELRVTLTDPVSAPARSMTFFSVGQGEAAAVAKAVLADFEAWLNESGVTPMPVPDWMRGRGG